MIKYRIITDSSSGISQEEAKQLGVTVLPLTLSYKGKDYKDGVDISTDEFYKMVFDEEKKDLLQTIRDRLKPEAAKTSMVPPTEFVNAMQEAIDEGEIPVVLPIAAVLSGTFNSANIAKDMLEDEEIYVIDSKTSLGSVKVLIKSVLSKTYETVQELLDHIAYLVKHVNFYAVPDTLEYLFRGGRLSRFSATVGNLLHLKPLIQLDRTGKLIPISKQRGLKHAYMKMVEGIKENPIDTNYPFELGYSTQISNVETLDSYIKEVISAEHPINQISPVVGAHVGPGAAALFYISTKEVADCK